MQKLIFVYVSFLYSMSSFAHGISEEAKRAMIDGGLFRYIVLGAEHMITGYDHLLFFIWSDLFFNNI